MIINQKQIALSYSLPAIVGMQPLNRQALVSNAGRDVAAVIAQAGLTIDEQKAAMTIANLYLQFFHEDDNNQKWSELMEAAIRRENVNVVKKNRQ